MKDPELDPLVQLGVAAGLMSLATESGSEVLNDVASMLRPLFGNGLREEWKRQFLGGKQLVALELEINQWVYRLACSPPHLEATRSRHVRGIRLRSDSFSVTEWLQMLTDEINREYEHRRAIANPL